MTSTTRTPSSNNASSQDISRQSISLARLTHLGVLAIDGVDATTFLQGQATCDCKQLSLVRGALGALCNLQGRMIVSFYVMAVDGGLRLIMPRDRVHPMLTHLKKYAVFSKVTLRDDSNICALFDAAEVLPATQYLTDENSGSSDFSVTAISIKDAVKNAWVMHLRGGRLLGLALIDAASAECITPADEHQQAAANATITDASNIWLAASIRAGELLIDTANADKFLPQALNYDVIDGVSFRKGCYTGQEVVARMHFKGRMKERLYVAEADPAAMQPAETGATGITPETSVLPAAGTDVLDDQGKHVGDVVAVAADAGRWLVAAVLRHDAVARNTLFLAPPASTTLNLPQQPYEIPA